MFRYSGLLKNSIRSVSGFNAVIHRKPDPAYRAIPCFVIAFAGSLKITVIFPKYFLQLGSEIRHDQ
jgi:hypothetical protein